MTHVLTIRDIARVCHEVNRAYCEAIGDHSQVPWAQAPDHIQDSAIAGVRYAVDNPEVTPQEQHEAWMDYKIDQGWIYGAEKDPVNLTHPCIVPYEELPLEQKVKDHLFRSVVRSLV